MTALKVGRLPVWAWGICRNIAQLDVRARLEIPHTATPRKLSDSAPVEAVSTLNAPSLSAASRLRMQNAAPIVWRETRKGCPDFWRNLGKFGRLVGRETTEAAHF